MLQTKRKRAVALALIAFFCTAAVSYVAVDWKRFGGGFLAFLKGRGEQRVATSGGAQSSAAREVSADAQVTPHADAAALSLTAVAVAHSHPVASSGGHGKSDDDLFIYGNPAAGGIPSGSFIVARNEAPAGGSPAPESGTAAAGGGDASPTGGGSAGSPAPGPGNAGLAGGGLFGTGTGKAPAPSPATSPTPPASPTPSPAAATPGSPAPAPAPAPAQSGTGDSNPESGGDPGAPISDPVTPITPLSPASTVPEASSLAMMSLGTLFLAVAAQRRRKNG